MTQVMGIVNVTPDSFSDGGRFYRPEEAVRRVFNLIEEGADIIDLGGESTRPGAEPIGWEEEWRRLEDVLAHLAASAGPKKRLVPLSVDTYHPETAERALAAGASIVNCVRVEPIPRMIELCAKANATLVLPASYEGEVSVPHYLDPMIGFGTTREEDLSLLASVPQLARRGRVLVGVSRKRIVKRLTGEKVTGKNLGGNLALALWCARQGAAVVRVHDVRETVQALRVEAAMAENAGDLV